MCTRGGTVEAAIGNVAPCFDGCCEPGTRRHRTGNRYATDGLDDDHLLPAVCAHCGPTKPTQSGARRAVSQRKVANNARKQSSAKQHGFFTEEVGVLS